MLYKILAYFVSGVLPVFQFKNCKTVNVEKCHEFLYVICQKHSFGLCCIKSYHIVSVEFCL